MIGNLIAALIAFSLLVGEPTDAAALPSGGAPRISARNKLPALDNHRILGALQFLKAAQEPKVVRGPTITTQRATTPTTTTADPAELIFLQRQGSTDEQPLRDRINELLQEDTDPPPSPATEKAVEATMMLSETADDGTPAGEEQFVPSNSQQRAPRLKIVLENPKSSSEVNTREEQTGDEGDEGRTYERGQSLLLQKVKLKPEEEDRAGAINKKSPITAGMKYGARKTTSQAPRKIVATQVMLIPKKQLESVQRAAMGSLRTTATGPPSQETDEMNKKTFQPLEVHQHGDHGGEKGTVVSMKPKQGKTTTTDETADGSGVSGGVATDDEIQAEQAQVRKGGLEERQLKASVMGLKANMKAAEEAHAALQGTSGEIADFTATLLGGSNGDQVSEDSPTEMSSIDLQTLLSHVGLETTPGGYLSTLANSPLNIEIRLKQPPSSKDAPEQGTIVVASKSTARTQGTGKEPAIGKKSALYDDELAWQSSPGGSAAFVPLLDSSGPSTKAKKPITTAADAKRGANGGIRAFEYIVPADARDVDPAAAQQAKQLEAYEADPTPPIQGEQLQFLKSCVFEEETPSPDQPNLMLKDEVAEQPPIPQDVTAASQQPEAAEIPKVRRSPEAAKRKTNEQFQVLQDETQKVFVWNSAEAGISSKWRKKRGVTFAEDGPRAAQHRPTLMRSEGHDHIDDSGSIQQGESLVKDDLRWGDLRKQEETAAMREEQRYLKQKYGANRRLPPVVPSIVA